MKIAGRLNDGAFVVAGGAVLLMTLTMAALVLLRYGFGLSSIAAQEAVMYLHALAVCFGLASTLQRDQHVRIDIFYRRWSAPARLWVNRLGTLLLLLPFCLFVLWACQEYVAQAWARREASAEPSGLPWLWLLKTLLVIFPLQLALAGLVWLRRPAATEGDAAA